jgi:hypothetical protein
MKHRHLVPVLLAVILPGCSPKTHRSSPPDPAVLAGLEEMVDIRQRLAESQRLLVQAGRSPDDGSAEIALAEARMELANERQHEAEVIAQLKKIVTIHEGCYERAKAGSADRTSTRALDEVRLALLRAQVALARKEATLQP